MKVEPKSGKSADPQVSHDRPRPDAHDKRSSAGGVIRDVERYLRDGKLSSRESARIERRLERDKNLTPAQRQLASSLIDKSTSDGKFSRSEKDALRQLFRSEPTSAQKDTLSRFLDRAFKDERLDRSESRAFEKLLKSEGGVDEKLTSRVLDRLQKDGRLSGNESKLLDRVLNGEVDSDRRFLRNLDRAYRDGRLSDRELRQLSRQIDPVERKSGEIDGDTGAKGPQPPICRPPEGRRWQTIEGRIDPYRGGPFSRRFNEDAYRGIHELRAGNPFSRSLSEDAYRRIHELGFQRSGDPSGL